MSAQDGVTLVRQADTPVKNSSGDSWFGINTAVNVYWKLQSSYFRVPFKFYHQWNGSIDAGGLAGEIIQQAFELQMVGSAPPSSVNISLNPDDGFRTFNVQSLTRVAYIQPSGGPAGTGDTRNQRSVVLQAVASSGTFTVWGAEGDALVNIP